MDYIYIPWVSVAFLLNTHLPLVQTVSAWMEPNQDKKLLGEYRCGMTEHQGM
jgi:hypothetical protein